MRSWRECGGGHGDPVSDDRSLAKKKDSTLRLFNHGDEELPPPRSTSASFSRRAEDYAGETERSKNGDIVVGWDHSMHKDERHRIHELEGEQPSSSAVTQISYSREGESNLSRRPPGKNGGRTTPTYARYRRSSAIEDFRICGKNPLSLPVQFPHPSSLGGGSTDASFTQKQNQLQQSQRRDLYHPQQLPRDIPHVSGNMSRPSLKKRSSPLNMNIASPLASELSDTKQNPSICSVDNTSLAHGSLNITEVDERANKVDQIRIVQRHVDLKVDETSSNTTIVERPGGAYSQLPCNGDQKLLLGHREIDCSAETVGIYWCERSKNEASVRQQATSEQVSARNRLRERMLGGGDSLLRDRIISSNTGCVRRNHSNSSGSSTGDVGGELRTLGNSHDGKNIQTSALVSLSLNNNTNNPQDVERPIHFNTSISDEMAKKKDFSSKEDKSLQKTGNKQFDTCTNPYDDGSTSANNVGDFDLESGEETDDDHLVEDEKKSWSVRVNVISAVDLPVSAIPDFPLCPVLKFGLVSLPHDGDAKSIHKNCNTGKYTGDGNDVVEVSTDVDEESYETGRSALLSQVLKFGLVSIPESRVRCTSTKILSKRDHGSVDFHEEIRWDEVKDPYNTALAVELCARASLAPVNADESPTPELNLNSFAVERELLTRNNEICDHDQFEELPRSIVSSPLQCGKSDEHFSESPKVFREAATKNPDGRGHRLHQTTGDGGDDLVGGVLGMRAFFTKTRQHFEPRQPRRKTPNPVNDNHRSQLESAEAAAAVAQFLVDENTRKPLIDDVDAEAKDFEKTSLSGSTCQPPYLTVGQDVVLVKQRRKKPKVEDTHVRIGSVVVPMTCLPLEKALVGKEAARIESWYSLVDVSDDSEKTSRSRGVDGLPRVLLEISFSSPEVLDESEDEMDESDDENVDSFKVRSASEEHRSHIHRKITDPADDTTRFYNISSAEAQRQGTSLSQLNTSESPKNEEDPVLEPGVIDFVCVVGARDIGNQRDDDGSKGWVNTTPECCVLEQFPPNDEFHLSNGRESSLPDKIEWFCFPEGSKLWRGSEPPSHSDLNLKRFSASSPPNVASSIAAFDACLNCTTSFSWFVLSSTSEDYGSKNKKTYGAVIRFYAPAPTGIDQTQDDYAQFIAGGTKDMVEGRKRTQTSTAKRLWVPMGICLVSNLPIIGIMEAVLLRACEDLASRGVLLQSSLRQRVNNVVHQELANLIINFQRPIPGVLHCSIPFLHGERLHVTLPPPTGLPQLPHGSSVTSVCRLLGAEGLNMLLAAVLTECKILIHSDDVANLAMVAEVITTLIYPFEWALPYIPVLPDAMLEIVDAPMSFFLGIPTCSMKFVDPNSVLDAVVIDLDNGFSSQDYFDGRRGKRSTKVPQPLPASVASSISKAVFRLLREEEEVEEEYGAVNYPGSRSLPRLESESLAEREFRIAVSIQVCGLVRGYQECLFFVSASQPVFNRDRFLRNAPALFEDRRGNVPPFSEPGAVITSQRMLSPRSKRFLSLLVNTQHFHGLLERLENEDVAFFHAVMDTFDTNEDYKEDLSTQGSFCGYGNSKMEEVVAHLSKALQMVEDKIPTYRVDRKGKKKSGGWEEDADDVFDDPAGGFMKNEGPHKLGFSDDALVSSFTNDLLQQILDSSKQSFEDGDDISVTDSTEGVRSLSIKFLVELEKNPWRYCKLFDIPVGGASNGTLQPETETRTTKQFIPYVTTVQEKVKLKDAIGERRYRQWKQKRDEQKVSTNDNTPALSSGDSSSPEGSNSLDISSLLSSVTDDSVLEAPSSEALQSSDLSSLTKRPPAFLSSEQQRVTDAKDRDVLRRCLERAYEGTRGRLSRLNRNSASGIVSSISDSFVENGRDLICDAETALRNPSAQRFLVSVLSQRSRIENKKKQRRHGGDDNKGSRSAQASMSRLQVPAFECLVRLCCAMLDACMEATDFEPAYRLLSHTAGFCTVQSKCREKASQPPCKEGDESTQNSTIIYMTARIGLHPIFADLRLWEKVLSLHLEDKPVATVSTIGSNAGCENSDVEYEGAVATLYEMLGYGIPAEELARFATRVSEKRCWFASERGHQLLMLARRLCVQRDRDNCSDAGNLSQIAVGKVKTGEFRDFSQRVGGHVGEELNDSKWTEVGWSHPSSPSQGPLVRVQHELNRFRKPDNSVDLKDENDVKIQCTRRTAVTSIAAFGSRVIASGGLDGSVFLAHTIRFGSIKEKQGVVRGVRLEWESSGGRSPNPRKTKTDITLGVGSVSCLAAAKGVGYRHGIGTDMLEQPDEEELLAAMEGCRIVAGTTGGDLRVWSVKEVYAATALAAGRTDFSSISDSDIPFYSGPQSLEKQRIDVPSSGYIRSHTGSITEIAAGSASSRLKFSLKGRALSGHRGGVCCIDVPSCIYRPDTLVTGGGDGLIKLWSLRQTNRRGSVADSSGPPGRNIFPGSMVGSSGVETTQARNKACCKSDALSVLVGHGGRVLSVKSAWHGDRLISGGADRTVRLWDLSTSSGKCLNALSGHLGWVTQVRYWGPNTLVSASTDRSIALWDARARNSPLFVLRCHQSPVSDILVGSRTDPLMVSAASDGTVAAWDLRVLSAPHTGDNIALSKPVVSEANKQLKIIRNPAAIMRHCGEGKGIKSSGAVLLAPGSCVQKQSILSVGVDNKIKEWDVASGYVLKDNHTGHYDVVSMMETFPENQNNALGASNADSSAPPGRLGGIVTSSWDGTIRMKKLTQL